MTIDDVIRWVAEIQQARDDPESAHLLEDALYEDVLEAIADGTAEDPRAMAQAALQTAEIDFPRHRA